MSGLSLETYVKFEVHSFNRFGVLAFNAPNDWCALTETDRRTIRWKQYLR